MKVQVHTTVEVDINMEIVAKWFASLDDYQQAKFFTAVDKEADSWKSHAKDMQWFRVGSHLKTCECASEGARHMIREIFNGLENGTHI